MAFFFIKINFIYWIRIFIYNHVTDSINQLYGFKSKIERDIFTKLIEVKKIGVKSAFVILRKYSSEELNFNNCHFILIN